MASIITATTTSGLTQSADNSGVLQLASGTGNLVTVPSVTGTAMVSGNMPAFSAYQSTLQAVANSTYTKVQLQTEEFDTANCFDSTTNYRFTPNVAGYYQLNGVVNFSGASAAVICAIYKNGAEYKRGTQSGSTAFSGQAGIVSSIVYFNGSTDYAELYCLQGSGVSNNTSTTLTWFNGSLVRAA